MLGAEHVDRQLAGGTDAFGLPMPEMVAEFCRGGIWTRPQLSRRDRGTTNMVMRMVFNRGHESELHARRALNNGLTVKDIREALGSVDWSRDHR